ncbi:MAG: glycerophosphoryl diester phosphodiesterase [Actinomycetia bacterium]|nr:glycerophosphoryl diester phosphodiesterase [Actinomycetes bacterium]
MATRPLVLGHRGAPRRARENTLEAFTAARTLGADGVELDVRRTSDGTAVIHHDPAVEGYGLIVSRPFAELRAERPYVPTLVEALDTLTGLFVNIEMKCLPWEPDPDPEGQVAAAVAAAVSERRITQQVEVSSFDLGALGVMRSIDARIPIGWLTFGQPVEPAVAAAVDRGLAWVHPDRAAVMADPAAAMRTAHERGLRVAVWTVNEPDDVRALAAAAVDALITDVPDVALAALS